jgi:spermidine synthase
VIVPLRVLLVCFFLSGATGLVYQVIWLRMLGLVFGHTVYAITTVLAAFMAGLALGSFLFGRLADRIASPLRVYGWLEVAIGVYCALIPLLLGGAALLYISAHRALGLSYDTFNVVQFALVFAVLLVPTSLMGGTLPVLSQAFMGHPAMARNVGLLYTTNTFGAVAGVALAGYLLLPTLGTRTTIVLAAMANLAVGGVALAWARRRPPAPAILPVDSGGIRGNAVAGDVPRSTAVAVSVALAVSGALSMVYEVAWTRALALVIGSSTYAFSAMLLAFLAGIAGGSALYTLYGTRRRAPADVLAALLVGGGLAGALTILLFEHTPYAFVEALRWPGSLRAVQVVQVGVCVAVLLPLTLFIGATLPCAVAVVARAGRPGRDVGHLYASNTIGAIVGTIVGGYVLIPRLGIHATLRTAAAATLVLAAAVVLVGGRPTPRRGGAAAGAVLGAMAVVALIPPWDHGLMTSGPAIYAARALAAGGESTLGRRDSTLLYYRDGVSGTIAVHRHGVHLALSTNGKVDASTSGDMLTQLMIAHLPLLVHPAPQTVAVIGLGSGVTAGAALAHPTTTRVDVVEIEPAVVEAARFFAAENRHVLDDPRLRLVIADGRNFLQTTGERYDVIISEPSNPWIGGLAALFSEEFFALARERLQPGGVMLQWVQGYGLFPDDFRMVLNTFRRVFPETTVWMALRDDYLLLGRLTAEPIDLRLVRARYEAAPEISTPLARLGLESWASLLGCFLLGQEDAARLATGARVNVDDRLPLEFSAPLALYELTARTRIQELVQRHRSRGLPDVTRESRALLDRADVRAAIAAEYVRQGMPGEALEHVRHALLVDPDHLPSLVLSSAVEIQLHRPARGLEVAEKALARQPGNAEAHYRAGIAADLLGRRDLARTHFTTAVSLAPDRREYREALDGLTSP